MLIGELAKKTGCSRDTLRFYEKIGLIKGQARPWARNNYKHYDDALVEHILLIKCAKSLGFTLAEIKKLIVAWESNRLSMQEKRRIIQDKIGSIESKLDELRQVRSYLKAKLRKLQKAA
jgi:MerR family Zn(II)-responsive transcriptional regulator of zntA